MAAETTTRFRSHWAANVSDITPHTSPAFMPPAELQSSEDSSWIKTHKTEPPLDYTTVPEEDRSRTVVVTNIDPEASNARILDFLAFAGRIQAFAFGRDAEPGSDGSRERHGYITYEEPSSFTTALLLSGARLLSTNLSIAPYDAVFDADKTPVPPEEAEEDEGIDGEGVVDADSVAELDADFMVAEADSPVEHSTLPKCSIIAMILASGYVLSASAVTKAKAVDAGTLNLADKSSAAWAAAAAKARRNAAARGLGRGVCRVRYVMGSAIATAQHAAAAVARKAGLGGFLSKVSSASAKVKDQTKAEIQRRRQ
ncbi:uncharacterized protein AMSG_03079 [Thecamonas trahens ATCC 50062]|uniref:RRM domain-containing protein n=1 Tax=Thecamonas trahens ATCC 50062 TaxID=461836 RepID=A0A0L0D2U9_THETB|nr:hypothetical protein AMSG_03079 [Thecamonas trahens ATCC 50062]KNC46642.1 hypothetical protein AMSG_03079 [Thecamonas trahens ATCC 50062]|eukprot:XP_013760415.1 hypothetical protein AMSG_03079 [Thecamonas trahens ATCC 50062]